jgi:hypothetical protein
MTAYPHERDKPRYSYQLPVVVSATPKNAGPRGITRDVSESGVYFYTEAWDAHTRTFEFRIVMPAEITRAESRRALCMATVVRVEEEAARIGVAARIDDIVWM